MVMNAGTPAHATPLKRVEEYARNRFKDFALTELNVDIGSYRPIMVGISRGDVLLTPTDSNFKRVDTLGLG